jgi:hypothetical protein
VESLSLFRAEESQEESDARQSLGLVHLEEDSSVPNVECAIPDVVMAEPPTPAPSKTKESPLVPTFLEMPTIAPPPQPLPEKPEQTSQPLADPGIEAEKERVPSPFSKSNTAPVQIDMPIFVEEEEKNEEMPAIDLGSDSGSD